MISLIIKGDRKVAGEHAKMRGVPLTFITETSDPWTVAETPTTFYSRVAEWFCAHSTLPYPEGTLLLYTQKEPHK